MNVLHCGLDCLERISDTRNRDKNEVDTSRQCVAAHVKLAVERWITLSMCGVRTESCG